MLFIAFNCGLHGYTIIILALLTGNAIRDCAKHFVPTRMISRYWQVEMPRRIGAVFDTMIQLQSLDQKADQCCLFGRYEMEWRFPFANLPDYCDVFVQGADSVFPASSMPGVSGL